MYNDEKELYAPRLVRITEKVHSILKKERSRLKNKEKRKVSMSKLACNAIIKQYEN